MFAAVEKLFWSAPPVIESVDAIKVSKFRLSEILAVSSIDGSPFDCSRITKSPSSTQAGVVWVKVRKLIMFTVQFEFVEFTFLPMRPDFVTVTTLVSLRHLEKLEHKKDYSGTLSFGFNDANKTCLQYIVPDMKTIVEASKTAKKHMKLSEEAEQRILAAKMKEEEFDILPSIELGSVVMFQLEEALELLHDANKSRHAEITLLLKRFRKRVLEYQESLACAHRFQSIPTTDEEHTNYVENKTIQGM